MKQTEFISSFFFFWSTCIMRQQQLQSFSICKSILMVVKMRYLELRRQCLLHKLFQQDSTGYSFIKYRRRLFLQRKYLQNSPRWNCDAYKTHREIRLRNGKGIISLWKKYVLLYKCRENQGKKNSWNHTLALQAAT